MERTVQGRELIKDKVGRAFGCVVLFRLMPVGVIQEFSPSMVYEDSITYMTKGRVEFYLDGKRLEDRVAGNLSIEKPILTNDPESIFRIVVVEDHSRICIFKGYNKKLPAVKKIELTDGQIYLFPLGFKGLVCTGQLNFDKNSIVETKTFTIIETAKSAVAQGTTLIIDFTHG